LKDVASGKIAKSNQLIGNHGVRICEKLGTHANPLLEALVGLTAMCTIEFLETVLFDVKDFEYKDGTQEPNPFKENLDRLDEKSSYEMFKLVAGYFFVGLFAEGLLCGESMINIPELRNQFFNIYEFDDEDREIFYELLKLVKNDLLEEGRKDGLKIQALQLYEYIFKRAYNIKPPEFIFHMMNFGLIFKKMFSEVFVPALIEAMKEANKR